MENRLVLKYEHVYLRESDLFCLRGPHRIDDEIVDFYFAYLYNNSLRESEDVLLIAPWMSFRLQCECQDSPELGVVAESLGFSSLRLVLVPVTGSDGADRSNLGRGNWSLLVYDRGANAFFHLDTSRCTANSFFAMRLYERLKCHMGPRLPCLCSLSLSPSSGLTGAMKGNKCSCLAGVIAAAEPVFEECNVVQQSNSFDSGLYVLAFAEVICQWYARRGEECEGSKSESSWVSAVAKHVDGSLKQTMRGKVLELIESLGDGDNDAMEE